VSGLQGRDRLIVALDLPSADEALQLVGRLASEVSFFKIGWQLFLTGELRRLLDELRGRQVFLDLKVPGDIESTIRSVVESCVRGGVRFLTLSDSMPPAAIASARSARGTGKHPEFLMVPALSSQDASDLRSAAPNADVDGYIAQRASAALAAGCDGLIASGSAIRVVRQRHPAVPIVSPGIRPAGAATHDHKRHATPAEAIRMGADYLVVGRPIRDAPDPLAAARRIIVEIDRELQGQGPSVR